MDLSSEKAQEAIRIAHTLREHGYSAYLVGGCVRDLLLDREPADYDVATSATPDEVIRIFPQTYAVGAQFGVVLVPVRRETPEGERDNYAIEVATFRSDGAYSDGRHPDEVQFSKDARMDVQRRDFTINGLLLDPDTREVLDYVGGREDLQRGIIRTIGEAHQRFAKTSCACFVPCASPPASGTPLKIERWPRSRNWLRKSIRSAVSACVTKS